MPTRNPLRSQPLWAHEETIHAPLAAVEALVFAVQPGVFTATTAPVVLQGMHTDRVEITRTGDRYTVQVGAAQPSMIFLAVSPEKHRFSRFQPLDGPFRSQGRVQPEPGRFVPAGGRD